MRQLHDFYEGDYNFNGSGPTVDEDGAATMLLTEDTKNVLSQGGWYPGRKVDTGQFLKDLSAEHFVINSRALEFLREFWGLRFEYPSARHPGKVDDFMIRASAVAVWPEDMEVYSEAVGESLCPVGFAFSDHMVLAIGASGIFVAGFDDTLVRLGTSVAEGLETLCRGLDAPRIPVE